jgi:hypothetical protein
MSASHAVLRAKATVYSREQIKSIMNKMLEQSGKSRRNMFHINLMCACAAMKYVLNSQEAGAQTGGTTAAAAAAEQTVDAAAATTITTAEGESSREQIQNIEQSGKNRETYTIST